MIAHVDGPTGLQIVIWCASVALTTAMICFGAFPALLAAMRERR